jgi:hypothetical protein
MEYREKILGLMKIKGPLLPAAVAKELGTNILLGSAMLAELSDKGFVKISSLKVGGSPLYYLPDQKEMLQNFFSSLKEKDRQTAELLRDRKLLRDNEQDPLTRVSLRGIKDFAHPLEVTLGEMRELFWKWMMLPDSEAEVLIREQLGQPKLEQKTESKVGEPKAETKLEPKAEKHEQTKLVEAPKVGEQSEPTRQRAERAGVAEPEPRKFKQEAQKEIKQPKEPKPAKETKLKAADGEFTATLADFFGENKIKIVEESCSKKNSEYDFVIQMDSPVGSLVYYCKAKSKKTIGDADLAAAFVQGQLRKLPTLFLSTGVLSKKAKEMLGKEFKGMVVKQI